MIKAAAVAWEWRKGESHEFSHRKKTWQMCVTKPTNTCWRKFCTFGKTFPYYAHLYLFIFTLIIEVMRAKNLHKGLKLFVGKQPLMAEKWACIIQAVCSSGNEWIGKRPFTILYRFLHKWDIFFSHRNSRQISWMHFQLHTSGFLATKRKGRGFESTLRSIAQKGQNRVVYHEIVHKKASFHFGKRWFFG